MEMWQWAIIFFPLSLSAHLFDSPTALLNETWPVHHVILGSIRSVLWLMLINEMRACNQPSSYCSWSPNGAFDELSAPLINIRFTRASQNCGKLQLRARSQWHLRLMSLANHLVPQKIQMKFVTDSRVLKPIRL